MESLPLFLVLLLTLAAAKADDIADAKAAFAILLEYQKSDDVRSPELFSPDCVVTYTLTDGKTNKVATIPMEAFRKMLLKAIAQKHGNKDTYEDVKYTQEGASVRVNCTILYADSGKRGPFSVLYVRDPAGVFKIKEMKVTMPADAPPAGAA